MAHKKGVGSSRNGRDSNAQRLGVKRFGGESVPAIGVLHPVVAFIILGFAGRLAFEAGWGPRRRG